MPGFYADHNISAWVTRLLRDRGEDVATARERGLDRAKDGVHLLTAATLGRTLLTHNERDFDLLHDAWLGWSVAWGVAPRHAGIIVLPQDERWESARAVREIESVLRLASTSDPTSTIANQLWVWRPSKLWFKVAQLSRR